MIRFSILIIGFTVLANFSLDSQTMDMPARRCDPADRSQRYAFMAKEVSQANPKVNEDTVKADLAVIEKAQKSLDEHYGSKGFGPCDVDRATELTWVELRQANAHRAFTTGDFIQKAGEEWGGLKIKSIPAGAQIWVDEAPWAKPTDAQDLTHEGRRVIRLHLDDYEDSKGEIDVTAGQWVEYKKTLKKK